MVHILATAGEVDIFGLEGESERLAGVGQLLGQLKQLSGQLVHITHFKTRLEIILNHTIVLVPHFDMF